jgi:hypothetical protein
MREKTRQDKDKTKRQGRGRESFSHAALFLSFLVCTYICPYSFKTKTRKDKMMLSFNLWLSCTRCKPFFPETRRNRATTNKVQTDALCLYLVLVMSCRFRVLSFCWLGLCWLGLACVGLAWLVLSLSLRMYRTDDMSCPFVGLACVGLAWLVLVWLGLFCLVFEHTNKRTIGTPKKILSHSRNLCLHWKLMVRTGAVYMTRLQYQNLAILFEVLRISCSMPCVFLRCLALSCVVLLSIILPSLG